MSKERKDIHIAECMQNSACNEKKRVPLQFFSGSNSDIILETREVHLQQHILRLAFCRAYIYSPFAVLLPPLRIMQKFAYEKFLRLYLA